MNEPTRMSRTAGGLRIGDSVLDDTSHKYRTVRQVIHPDILSRDYVSLGMVHVVVAGSDTIWVFDSMAEVTVK